MEARNADLSALKIDRASESEASDKSKWKLWVGSIVAVLSLAVIGYFSLGNALSPATEVTLATAALSSPSQSNAVLTASGYVVAQRKAAIASKGTGRLEYLSVVEGDKVKKGDIIGRLEDADIKASLEQARANLRMYEADMNDAKQSLVRTKALIDKGIATQAEFDGAEARFNRVTASIGVAKATVTGAEVALENTLIRAPFDGTVLAKNANVGEIVAPLAASASSRAAVVTLADMSSLEVEADVSESNIERIKKDQACEISLDAYSDKRYEGFVSKIVPTADRAKATVMVKVGFRTYDNRVLPEMSAKVLFLTKASDPATMNAKPILTIPSAAVATRNGKNIVFMVRENQAYETTVVLGKNLGALVEITEGLSAGQKVISKVEPAFKDGMKIKAM
jgi:RND family efflux transporter MFP subunit